MADRGAGYPNPLDSSGEWYHGTQAHPEDLEHGFQDPMNSGEWNAWNATLGTHFTADHDLARKFAEGEHHLGGGDEDYDDWGDPDDEPNPSVVHARLHLRNPKVYDSEHDLDHEAYEHEWAAGNHPSKDFPDDPDERSWDEEHERPGMYEVHREFGDSKIPREAYSPMGTRNAGHPVRQIWLTTHPDMHGIAQRFRDRLEAQGHDGIVYGNEWERGAHGRSAPSVIAFHPHQIEITQHHGEAEEHPGHSVVAHFDDDEEELDDPERGNWDDEHGLYHHPENGWHCPTCQDFHDDAETVNGHQTAYTDWDRVHPGLPEHMHRGFAVALPRELHDAVHDESRPAADRARMLLDHLGSEGHGTHWTPDEGQAGHYAGVSAHQNSGSWNGASGQTHIVLHARRPELEHIETDPDTLASQDVIGFGEHDDAEIPLRQGAPVHLTGVSWRHESEPWTRHEMPAATEHTAVLDGSNGLSWDEIGERHPAIYGDPEVHGEEADGSDGPGIGEAASHLAFSRPEDPDAEGHSVHDLTFHQRTVDPARIDYQHNERFDPRVQRARQGFRGQLPGEHVPPLILVHRHGVFQVADGHHRAEGADLEHRPVRAYVAYSPHEHEPFGDGERGPYHGAETEERPPLTDAMSGRTTRLAYEGWPYAAEVPAPHTAALVTHFEGTKPAVNPPCYYCHDPLNDEDIQDGQSAHEECSDMRWCDACNEEHEDPQEAEDHNSTYTDWGGHVFDDGIHRGVTVRLPDDVHAIVHDSSRPSAERAAALASYLHANPVDEGSSHGRAAGYGVHWTDHLPTAQAWGSGEGAMFGINDSERKDPHWTHVVMHAATPDDDDFETDPEELSRRNMLGYDHDRSEREIPLTAAAPVHLTALSWKPAGSPADGWERHALPPEHHAATASVLEHFEDDAPRYHPEAVCPTCRGRNWHPAQLSDDLPNHLHELPAPAECNNCHDIFDASKSGRQVAEEREQEHRDWEEATRNRAYNGEPLFHGTRSELHPGELLTPGEAERHPAHPDKESLGYVHATPSGEEAYGWGERASGFETHDRMTEMGRTQPIRPGHNQGDAYRPRVYHVEPTGPVESDPNGEGSSFRTAHPLRVVQEVHPLTCYHEDHEGAEHWPDHPHYEFLKNEQDDEDEDDDDNWGEHDASLDDEDENEHDGDGYTTCDQGHEHWGLNGAAGLLIRHQGDDGQTRYLLQHRSPHVQHGNTWSTPGGAMGSSETPEHAALREATEEMGALPGNLTHHHTHTDDHGGWAYHTVVMDSPRQFAPRGHGEDDWESSGAQWLTPREIGSLPLHPGFRSSWDRVQHSGTLVAVTAADVPSFTHNYQTYGPEGGYIDQQREVTGPFYHGGRSRRLGEGDQLTPGRKTNGWGDEGSKSQYVHFTTNLNGAAEYARQAGGHVYEVEPTGDDVQMGYSGDEWKSKAPLRVRRVVPPAEIEQHAHTGKLVVAANVADRAPARVIAPALPAGATARDTLGDWMPQNAAETHDMLDGFPVLFTAIYDGLMGVVARLEDSPVSGEITGIVRTMATACQTAAEDATEIAARPLDGPEGMWEGSLAGKA